MPKTGNADSTPNTTIDRGTSANTVVYDSAPAAWNRRSSRNRLPRKRKNVFARAQSRMRSVQRLRESRGSIRRRVTDATASPHDAWADGHSLHAVRSGGAARTLSATSDGMPAMPEILVLYYSRGGSVARLARLIARGIEEVDGMHARLRSVPPVSAVTQQTAPPVPEEGAPYVEK